MRVVAGVKAAKGMLILLAGFGLLALIHKDLQQLAEDVVRHFHLNPAHHYPRIFIVGGVTATVLWEITRHVLVWYFGTLSQVAVVYGSLTTSIVVLLSLEIATTLLSAGPAYSEAADAAPARQA